MKKHIITAALPYANGPIHLGHLAGVYLPADIYYRHLKLKGEDAIFICGSDENGAAITMSALKNKTTPRAIVDKNYNLIKKSFDDFGISFDSFERTTSSLHHKTAQDFFLELLKENFFLEKETEQFYDSSAKQFLADRFITGQCPKCESDDAYGDQCEKCGSTLSPKELINPKSTLSGKKPSLKKTKLWYLPLDKHESWLKKWVTEGKIEKVYQHNPKLWRKQVIGQCLSWINSKLTARSITRDLNWGVQVPLETAEGKVLYVWFDAPIGYISATKSWAKANNKKWEDYWKNESSELIHFIGKDNIVFHCIIFPAILKGLKEFILPKNIAANEFLNLEGEKFSTSKNHAVWLHEYLKDFPKKQDELRYVLTSIAPETKDSDFTWKDFQKKINNELVAILGNFVNRTLVLTHKYYNGVIPNASKDKSLEDKYITISNQCDELLKQIKIKDAQVCFMQIARMGNKYLTDSEPWKVIKTNQKKVDEIIYNAITLIFYLGKVSAPFLPSTSKKILTLLNIKDYSSNPEVNHKVGSTVLLFEKIEDKQIEKQMEKLGKKENQILDKEIVDFSNFKKYDYKVVTVKEAEKHPNADNLLVLKVEKENNILLTIVSGIAQYYEPKDLIGKQVMALLNLPFRKIRGIESQGMLLLAENDKKLVFMVPETAVNSGDKIG